MTTVPLMITGPTVISHTWRARHPDPSPVTVDANHADRSNTSFLISTAELTSILRLQGGYSMRSQGNPPSTRSGPIASVGTVASPQDRDAHTDPARPSSCRLTQTTEGRARRAEPRMGRQVRSRCEVTHPTARAADGAHRADGSTELAIGRGVR